MTRFRNVAVAVAVVLLAPLTVAMPSRGATLGVTFRNRMLLGDSATDQNSNVFTVTGLSGLTHSGGSQFWAAMDSSDKLVELDVTLGASGLISAASVTAGLTLSQTWDLEGIAYTDPVRNSVFVSEETTPGVHEYSLADGSNLQSLDVPDLFTNIVGNRGFESLGRKADGALMITANEEALTVDGPVSTSSTGTIVRLLHYDVVGNAASAAQQYAYETAPIHNVIGTPHVSGLVDLVVLPNGKVLTLERSGAFGLPPFENRIYELDFTGATDVSGLAGLIGQTFTLVQKDLLWSSTSDIGENLEGLALGPQLLNGNHALLGIVDDGDSISSNTLAAFELTGDIPEPGTGMLLVFAAVWVCGRRRPI